MNAFEVCGMILAIAFGVLCAYQTLYIAVSLISGKRRKKPESDVNRRFAVLIAARNEEMVIGQLIDSVKAQNYPYGLIDVYVAADNCTDSTAAVSLSHGARVYVRNDTSHIGKGYVLRFLLDKIKATGKWYDAFLVLDADNLLDSGYIKAMNDALSGGCDIVTGYRNSKNFGDNWISAGYSLWFLRESRLLNHARDILGTSAAVGTASCSPRILSSTPNRFSPGSESDTRRTPCSTTNSRPILFSRSDRDAAGSGEAFRSSRNTENGSFWDVRTTSPATT